MFSTAIATLALALASVSASEVCFDGLPCFSTDAPWWTLMRPMPAPDSPESVDTHFTLYSRANPVGHRLKVWPEIVINETSGYSVGKQTFFITHGYFNNGNFTWMITMKNALLELMDANVIIVGWGHGALKFNYFQSVANTRIVGAEMARFGKYLISNYSANPMTFHLIGHSLGAHIVAYMGKGVANIGKITALDPAQPGYEGYSCEVRLCVGDAHFIEAIHTDAKPFVAPWFGVGFMEAVADVDFFMNGGSNQPGCKQPNFNLPITSLEDLATMPVEIISELIACDHMRSIEYFLCSLRNKNCTFWGHHTTKMTHALDTVSGGWWSWLVPSTLNCTLSTCSPMGLKTADYPARGTFEITTTGKAPYCIYDANTDLAMAKALEKYETPK